MARNFSNDSIPITVDSERLRAFCEKNHIQKLAFFGSVLRPDFGESSDVDVLVEFHPDETPGLLGVARLELELSELLGRRVDLRTPDDLSPYFRDEVLRQAIVQYAS